MEVPFAIEQNGWRSRWNQGWVDAIWNWSKFHKFVYAEEVSIGVEESKNLVDGEEYLKKQINKYEWFKAHGQTMILSSTFIWTTF